MNRRISLNDSDWQFKDYMGKTGVWSENIQAFLDYIAGLKPNSIKGTYIKSVAICATTSPSVRVAA